jgi:hypothetical protein
MESENSLAGCGPKEYCGPMKPMPEFKYKVILQTGTYMLVDPSDIAWVLKSHGQEVKTVELLPRRKEMADTLSCILHDESELTGDDVAALCRASNYLRHSPNVRAQFMKMLDDIRPDE